MPHPHNGPERPLVPERPLPPIIQGGMGAGVSDWRLARAVAQEGQMGVVSGTALDTVLARRLQQGDPGGHLRRALAAFPWPHVAEAYLSTHLIPGGKAPDVPYRLLPMPTIPCPGSASRRSSWRTTAGVAGGGARGPVGINYLERSSCPTCPRSSAPCSPGRTMS